MDPLQDHDPLDLDAVRARELLAQADQTEATARAGASWTAIALLMVIGAGSSTALVGTWLAGADLLGLPMSLFFVWMAIGFVIHYRFGNSVKRGFSRRWLVSIGLWAATWMLGVFVTAPGAIGDNIWVVGALALALTAVTAVGAWREASA
ncbi:hypothetical protein [Propionicimonas sp.]|uniref:hypothetical protein n=1 Tax=Propionicimonas sp. TaxID=1955623 RepID=UPI00179EF518|nr:hypothetical protein [Propionicimonas sp.]MBU3977794.1 hypothetical protein [Actinomycetota bacterium]MBA3021717.1 hypothetical protein [Propionicimonas sp.]MBU3987268.1 hypothetical protein [Actinomycetota bacterium]MBU4009089.1 hypothetical protein [Actinomycetota bacterium]MBU4065761.1 hypothetical protein [Actinomycetota bacterium]